MGKVKTILGTMLYRLPGKKCILLESNPVLQDNTGALFRKMLEQGWNRTYRLIWVLEPGTPTPDLVEKNVKWVYRQKKKRQLDLTWYRIRAAAVVDCNNQVAASRPGTPHLYLTHGSPIKSVKDYYFCEPTTTHMLNQSPFFTQINARELHMDPERFVTLGYPRNDDLFSSPVDLQKLFGPEFRRFVVWYPTYRQHKGGMSTTSISIPVVHDPQAAAQINEIAREYETLIVIKPHPAQDVSRLRNLNLSHVRFISDELFRQNGITSYAFLGATDALITDYSSVLFDYLLTDKPIGVTFEDIAEYAVKPGFALDPEMLTEGCQRLDGVEDFRDFLQNLATGTDPRSQARRELKNLTNTWQDNGSSQRVLDFLEQQIRI